MELVTATTMVGLGASRGTARGPARRVRCTVDALAAPPGAVLLVDRLPAAWVPFLDRPAAVVTAAGGALATAATALRERGIPAVFGVGPGLDAVADGELLEVDGAAGTARRA